MSLCQASPNDKQLRVQWIRLPNRLFAAWEMYEGMNVPGIRGIGMPIGPIAIVGIFMGFMPIGGPIPMCIPIPMPIAGCGALSPLYCSCSAETSGLMALLPSARPLTCRTHVLLMPDLSNYSNANSFAQAGNMPVNSIKLACQRTDLLWVAAVPCLCQDLLLA